MKQSPTMRCEILPLTTVGRINAVAMSRWLQEEVQKRLNNGWTLRAGPVMDGTVYLVFVRKEAKQSP